MRTVFLSLLGLFAVGLNAQDLDSLKIEALQNNPSVLSSYQLFEAEMERVAQVNALPDPQLSVGVFIRPIETRVGSQVAKVSISQMFPWFGTLSARGDAAALQAEAAYEVFLNRKMIVIRSLESSYFDWLEWKESLEILEDDLSLLHRILSTAEIRAEAGQASLSDVLRLQIRVGDVQSKLLQLKNKESVLLANIRSQLNRADSIPLVMDASPIESFDATFQWPSDTVLANHPRVSRFLSLRNSEAYREEAARKSGYPSIGVGLDYMAISPRSDMSVPNNGRDAIMPMVTVSLPIFRSKYNSSIREAEWRQSAYESQSQKEINDLRNEWEEVKFEWLYNLEEVRRLKSNVEKATSTLRLLEAAYETDGADFNGVIEVEEILLRYRLEALSAKVNLLKNKSQLDYLLGRNIER
ncbi:MAG: TolC family protein [Bacteroidetes bacterium]|nr:MAG: TolC family protein [Bacteroidota bacterium]